MGEWQPIETAPKDRYVLFGGAGWVAHGWYAEGRWWMRYPSIVGVRPPSKEDRTRGEHPTHWMPLPQPPDAPIV